MVTGGTLKFLETAITQDMYRFVVARNGFRRFTPLAKFFQMHCSDDITFYFKFEILTRFVTPSIMKSHAQNKLVDNPRFPAKFGKEI